MIAQTAELDGKVADAREARGDDPAETETPGRERRDWRDVVGENPLIMLGLAFAGGIAVASMNRPRTGPRRARRRRPVEANGERAISEDPSDGDEEQGGDVADEGRSHEVWESLRAALIEVTTEQVASYLDELLPGTGPAPERKARRRTAKSQGRSDAA